METSPRVSSQQFAESMKQEFEEFAAKVMESVNDAPDGQWITGSEEQVRDLSAEMRRRIFERALQKRLDAAEAAFPPSARSDDGQRGPRHILRHFSPIALSLLDLSRDLQYIPILVYLSTCPYLSICPPQGKRSPTIYW
jgi:hypothetical protein